MQEGSQRAQGVHQLVRQGDKKAVASVLPVAPIQFCEVRNSPGDFRPTHFVHELGVNLAQQAQ
ncbi:MAG: hypothetical protein U1E57_09990 [Paenacidovorax caeni]